MTSPRRRVSAAPALAMAAAVAMLAALLVAAPTRAAAGDITTVAGGPDLVERPATQILQSSFGLARDGKILYVADPSFHVVRAIDTTTGMERVVAGTGARGSEGDGGPATSARLNGPSGVAVDSDGRVLIADTGNNKVRRMSIGGAITTIAGTGNAGYRGDCDQATTTCPATAAQIDHPLGVAGDGAGNVYVADTTNDRVRRIDPSGGIATVAGNGTYGFTGDGGPATLASIARPGGLAIGTTGSLHIAHSGNHRVRTVDNTGTITTTAGGGIGGLGDDGPATGAQLKGPMAVSVDDQGRLLIADTDNNRVRRVASSGTITATATTVRLLGPKGVAAGAGQFFCADTGNHRVRGVDASNVLTTIAGSGRFGPAGLAIGADGAVLGSRSLQQHGAKSRDGRAADPVRRHRRRGVLRRLRSWRRGLSGHCWTSRRPQRGGDGAGWGCLHRRYRQSSGTASGPIGRDHHRDGNRTGWRYLVRRSFFHNHRPEATHWSCFRSRREHVRGGLRGPSGVQDEPQRDDLPIRWGRHPRRRSWRRWASRGRRPDQSAGTGGGRRWKPVHRRLRERLDPAS